MPKSENNQVPNQSRRQARRRRRGSQDPGGETPPEMRRFLEQRDRLYEEARRDPESDAADLARTFIITGMLAGQRGAGESSQVARLERIVRDQRTQLDDFAQAARQAQEQKLDAREVCRRIAAAVGLFPSSQADFESIYPAAAYRARRRRYARHRTHPRHRTGRRPSACAPYTCSIPTSTNRSARSSSRTC